MNGNGENLQMTEIVTDHETLHSFLQNEDFNDVILGEWKGKLDAFIFLTAHPDDPNQLKPGMENPQPPTRWAIGIWAQVKEEIPELTKRFEREYDGQRFVVRCEQIIK